MHALGLEFGSAAQLSERPGSVWNCLWGNALKRSPGIIRKSRVSYPVPGFLSSATWPPLPKQHYNGLNQTKPNVLCPLPPPPTPIFQTCIFLYSGCLQVMIILVWYYVKLLTLYGLVTYVSILTFYQESVPIFELTCMFVYRNNCIIRIWTKILV